MSFPFRTGLAVALTIGLISAAHFVLPVAPVPASSLLASLTEFTPEITPPVPLVRHDDVGGEERIVTFMPALSPLEDFGGALNAFYEALWKTERGRQAYITRIVHYGDSPTTADLITGDIRMLLQARFGNSGPGFALIAKPWAWYRHSDVDVAGEDWQIEAASRSVPLDGLFGLGGVSFTADAGAHSVTDYRAVRPVQFEVWYLAQPDGGSFEVIADGTSVAHVDTHAETTQAGFSMIHPATPVQKLEIRVTHGSVRLFGVAAENAGPGLVYDSLGMNGASITVLSRMFNPDFWAVELRHRKPNLLIINYGTNEASSASFVNGPYEKELREAVRRARTAAPEASVLLMSPMDRGERIGLEEIQTMATIPKIVDIEKRVAADMGVAFFNTFDAMGGDGTMARWYQGKRRLVAGDLIHPGPEGAQLVAKVFVKELMLGYNLFKLRHLIEDGGGAPPRRVTKAGEGNLNK